MCRMREQSGAEDPEKVWGGALGILGTLGLWGLSSFKVPGGSPPGHTNLKMRDIISTSYVLRLARTCARKNKSALERVTYRQGVWGTCIAIGDRASILFIERSRAGNVGYSLARLGRRHIAASWRGDGVVT